VWALERPCRDRQSNLLADTPVTLLGVLASVLVLAAGLCARGVLPSTATTVVGVAAGHGALLATALAWAMKGRIGPGLTVVGLLAGAALLARIHPVGLAAFVAPILWVAGLSWRGHLWALGLGSRFRLRYVVQGVAIGVLLGGHLLVSASRTLRVTVGAPPPVEFLGWLAYDAGANVLAAECFFRGALFGRAQRRWSAVAGGALATTAYVFRYLVDPLLPKSVELVVGAVFYLTLLGALNCWLLWRSGSLLPGLSSALLFFTAWRMVHVS